jgi:hypothetical protein
MENPRMADTSIRVRCVCGWEASGTEDEVVVATTDHGERVHNMRATRDEILAMAIPPDVPNEAGSAG